MVHLSISGALVDKWCTCRLVVHLSISDVLVDYGALVLVVHLSISGALVD